MGRPAWHAADVNTASNAVGHHELSGYESAERISPNIHGARVWCRGETTTKTTCMCRHVGRKYDAVYRMTSRSDDTEDGQQQTGKIPRVYKKPLRDKPGGTHRTRHLYFITVVCSASFFVHEHPKCRNRHMFAFRIQESTNNKEKRRLPMKELQTT